MTLTHGRQDYRHTLTRTIHGVTVRTCIKVDSYAEQCHARVEAFHRDTLTWRELHHLESEDVHDRMPSPYRRDDDAKRRACEALAGHLFGEARQLLEGE